MNRKITALALGLLLVLVPGVFAQMNTGGTQTFTFPRLTINPGPFSLSGSMTVGGDLTIGAAGQLFLPDGTATDPSLAFTSDSDTGIFRDVSGTPTASNIGFTGQGATFALFGSDNATESNFYLYAPHVGPTEVAFSVSSGASAHTIQLGNINAGGTALNLSSGTTATQMIFGASQVPSKFWVTGLPAGTPFEIDYNPGFGADHNTLIWADPAAQGDQQITLPALTGTLLVGGATNTLGAVTTTINSGTQFNIHSNENITLDGDADNAGGGTVSLLADNDTQQVLLTNTAVQVVSDGTFGVTVDNATDSSTIVVAPTTLTLDADADTGDAPGTVTLSADSAAHQILVGTAGITANSDGAISLTSNDGVTNLSSLSLDSSGPTLGITVTDGTANSDIQMSGTTGVIDIIADDGTGPVLSAIGPTDIVLNTDDGTSNASLTLDGDGNAATLSVSDGTDSADIRMGQASVTINADVDDDGDGAVTLAANNDINQVVVGGSSLTSPMTVTTDVSTTRFGQDDLAWADNAAETLFTFDIADTGLQMGKVRYFSRFNSGGGTLVSNANEAIFTCVNEADAEVCAVQAVATEASAVDGDSGVTMACTVGYTAGTNAVSITLTCDTSDGSGGTVDWVMESESLVAITAVGS